MTSIRRYLPFAWNFYGTTYTQVTPLQQRHLQFVASGSVNQYQNGCLPSTVFSVATMMPHWTIFAPTGPDRASSPDYRHGPQPEF